MSRELVPPPRSSRIGTDASHRRIVDRGLMAIRIRFAEEHLRLAEIAQAASSSPFHFARLFRRISGVPPRHFLTAVRMQAAKRLLAESRVTVTNVCLDVGYNSLGTFTRRFTELVGVGPFRRLARALPPLDDVLLQIGPNTTPVRRGSVSGFVQGPRPWPIAIGLFPTPLAQGRPVRCCLLRQPGPYRITDVPNGRFYVLAVAFDQYSSLSKEPEYRGGTMTPIDVTPSSADQCVDVTLRPPHPTDPPIVVCIPWMAMTARLTRAKPPQPCGPANAN
jgi:AraC family transcriptional regulator